MPVAKIDIGNSFQKFFDGLIGFLPHVIGFLIILLVGYVIAKVVRTAVNKILERVGVDRRLHETPVGQYVERISPGNRPSHLIGGTAFWIIFLVAIVQALQALKLPALNGFLVNVQNYLPNIVAAVIIFVIAAALAGGVAAIAAKLMGDTPTGKFVATVAPTLILTIATFMILNQLKIAPQIVTITYAALLGMLALAGGLAFGLGGRDVAARILGDAHEKSGQAIDQAKSDAELAKSRGQEQASQVQGQVQGAGGGQSGTGGGGGAVSGTL